VSESVIDALRCCLAVLRFISETALPRLKLDRLPPSLAATLAALPSISETLSSIPGFLISLDIFMKPLRVEVNDKMQKGYPYFRTKPIGRAFRLGFTPELTPKQMLDLGVFGGKYMTDCRTEFPSSWFTRAKPSPDRARDR
jgi:hypothetical protein